MSSGRADGDVEVVRVVVHEEVDGPRQQDPVREGDSRGSERDREQREAEHLPLGGRSDRRREEAPDLPEDDR